jgi:hypothetical protein
MLFTSVKTTHNHRTPAPYPAACCAVRLLGPWPLEVVSGALNRWTNHLVPQWNRYLPKVRLGLSQGEGEERGRRRGRGSFIVGSAYPGQEHFWQRSVGSCALGSM